MREMSYFSTNVVTKFDNNYDNMVEFNTLLMNAAHEVYDKYNKEETERIIRNQFNAICGVADFKALTTMQQRQVWREHGKEIASLVENVIADKMKSGWNEANAKFMQFVKEINIADGDQNEFYVEDNSLLQVSRFAGDHLDVKLIYTASV